MARELKFQARKLHNKVTDVVADFFDDSTIRIGEPNTINKEFEDQIRDGRVVKGYSPKPFHTPRKRRN